MPMILRFHTHTPEDTQLLGRRLGKLLTGDEAVFLAGYLGAGKTLLTKGIAEALGVDPTEVVSPTFTLINEYNAHPATAKQQDDYPRLIHVDCYRLLMNSRLDSRVSAVGETEPHCFRSDGIVLPEIDEVLGETVVIVEWAQYLHNDYSATPRSLCVRLVITGAESRRIELQTSLPRLASLAATP